MIGVMDVTPKAPSARFPDLMGIAVSSVIIDQEGLSLEIRFESCDVRICYLQ